MPQEPTPEGLEALLMELIIELGLQRGDALVPDLAMTVSEGLALLEIRQAGPVPQQHVADRLRLEKSSVSRLIAGLERKGWLLRERDQANRRYYRLTLSDAGRAVLSRMSAHLHERHGQVLARLSAAERSALAVALPALTRALRETTAASAS